MDKRKCISSCLGKNVCAIINELAINLAIEELIACFPPTGSQAYITSHTSCSQGVVLIPSLLKLYICIFICGFQLEFRYVSMYITSSWRFHCTFIIEHIMCFHHFHLLYYYSIPSLPFLPAF
jgi:hypothetical protein